MESWKISSTEDDNNVGMNRGKKWKRYIEKRARLQVYVPPYISIE
jgi:hypothetical protein